jgi:hypothetical protein
MAVVWVREDLVMVARVLKRWSRTSLCSSRVTLTPPCSSHVHLQLCQCFYVVVVGRYVGGLVSGIHHSSIKLLDWF